MGQFPHAQTQAIGPSRLDLFIARALASGRPGYDGQEQGIGGFPVMGPRTAMGARWHGLPFGSLV